MNEVLGWLFVCVVAVVLVSVVAFLRLGYKAVKSESDLRQAKLRKEIARLGMVFLGMLVLTGCTRIEPGNVGVKVNNYGEDRGVQEYVLQTGMVGYMPIAQRVFEYPTYMQTVRLTGENKVSFNSKEGTVFTVDLSFSYKLIPEKVPHFYVTFRSDDLDSFTHGFMRNVVRDALNDTSVGFTAEEVYADKKEVIIANAQQKIADKMAPYGVHIEQFGFLTAPTPPSSIVAAIDAKTQAIQNAIKTENELRATKAEAEKAVAEAQGAARSRVAAAKGEAEARVIEAKGIAEAAVTEMRGKAEANKMEAASLTALVVQRKMIQQWNGELPQIVGNANVFSSLKSKLKVAEVEQ